MKPQINYVASSKLAYQPVSTTPAMTPVLTGTHLLYGLLAIPLDPTSWLAALGVNCATYARNYRADPTQSVFAVSIAQSDAVRRLYPHGRALAGRDGLLDPALIAQQLYSHCVAALGQAPVGPYKVSGLAMGSVAGLDVKSVLIGAALGALAMHLSMK